MQRLIIALYKQLGQSDYSAWFSMCYETQDWDALAELVDLYRTHGDRLFRAAGPAA